MTYKLEIAFETHEALARAVSLLQTQTPPKPSPSLQSTAPAAIVRPAPPSNLPSVPAPPAPGSPFGLSSPAPSLPSGVLPQASLASLGSPSLSVVPPPPPSPAAPSDDLDAFGAAWSADVHTKKPTKDKSGRFKFGRGLDKQVKADWLAKYPDTEAPDDAPANVPTPPPGSTNTAAVATSPGGLRYAAVVQAFGLASDTTKPEQLVELLADAGVEAKGLESNPGQWDAAHRILTELA